MQALTTDGLAADALATHDWLVSLSGGAVSQVGSIGYCLGGRAAFIANLVAPVQAAISYYGGGIAPNPARNQPGLLARAGELNAPMLLFWAGKDAHITREHYRAIEDAMITGGKSYTQVVFSDADHGFFCDERGSYEPNAARQAWLLTLDFLRVHLDF